jgi:hypothetical protein
LGVQNSTPLWILLQQPREDRDHPRRRLIEGADPTIAALTGRIDVRFADTMLIDLAAEPMDGSAPTASTP